MGSEDSTLHAGTPIRRTDTYAPLQRGTEVGRYVVLEELGRGAMGRVYSAYDPQLDRRVALKQVRLEHLGQAQRESAQRALLKEAQALARLGHAHVVGVHDVLMHADDLVVAMEFIDGVTLGAWARGECEPSWQQRVARLLEAAQGLVAAHTCGIVHRDFKPDNVMIDARRGAKVVDFGLAQALQDGDEAPDEQEASLEASLSCAPSGASLGESWTVQSQTGAIVGTPAYMAPEQLGGAVATPASDQFAFCVSAFEVLFGHRPFSTSSVASLYAAKQRGSFQQPPKDSSVPRRIRQAILRGLAPDPADRHASMRAMVVALRGRANSNTARAAIGGGLLVGAAVFGGMQMLNADANPCAMGAAEIGEVWTPSARDALHRQLQATAGAPTSSSVLTHLDDFTQQWASERDTACAATHVQRLQSTLLLDRRVACLDGLRTDLTNTLQVLSEGDASVRVRAVDITRGLGRVEDCGNIERLLAATPPPGTEQAAEVRASRDALSLAQTLIRAAQYDAALEEANRAHTLATTSAYRPAIAEALLWQGFTQDRLGQWDAAETSLSNAVWLAQRVGHDPVVARAMTELVFVVGRHIGRHQDGLLWARHADAVIERLDDPLELARLKNNRATVLSDTAQHTDARADYEQAIEIRTQHLGATHPDTLTTRMNLAALLDSNGEYEAASTTYEAVLTMRRALFGGRHPHVAAVLVNYGELLARTGEPKRAARLIQEAIDIFVETNARPSLHATALQNLAVAHYYDDQLPAALAAFEEVLEVRTRLLGPDHADVAYVHLNLGGVALDMNDMARARREFDLARAGLEAKLGPDHTEVADVLLNSAVLEIGENDMALAAKYARRSVDIRTKALPASHPDTGHALCVLAEAELGLHLPALALQHSEAAIDIFHTAERVPPWRVTKAHYFAATARAALGQEQHADLDALAKLATALPPDRADLRQQIETLLESARGRE